MSARERSQLTDAAALRSEPPAPFTAADGGSEGRPEVPQSSTHLPHLYYPAELKWLDGGCACRAAAAWEGAAARIGTRPSFPPAVENKARRTEAGVCRFNSRHFSPAPRTTPHERLYSIKV